MIKSTTQVLKSERVLKEASADFLMMPTPRELSASCGLAVKMIAGKNCFERVNNG